MLLVQAPVASDLQHAVGGIGLSLLVHFLWVAIVNNPAVDRSTCNEHSCLQACKDAWKGFSYRPWVFDSQCVLCELDNLLSGGWGCSSRCVAGVRVLYQ